MGLSIQSLISTGIIRYSLAITWCYRKANQLSGGQSGGNEKEVQTEENASKTLCETSQTIDETGKVMPSPY